MLSIRELKRRLRMTNKQMAEAYGIPTRTLEEWLSGRSKPAPYVNAWFERIVLEDIAKRKDQMNG